MSQILVDIGVLDLLVLRLAANPTIRHTHAESAIAHLGKHGGLRVHNAVQHVAARFGCKLNFQNASGCEGEGET